MSYRNLEVNEIEKTIDLLEKRIHKKKNLAYIEKRHWLLRSAIAFVSLLLIGIVGFLITIERRIKRHRALQHQLRRSDRP